MFKRSKKGKRSEGGQVRVNIIAVSKWEANKIRHEYKRRRKMGGEVSVEGNAINGFVRSSRLNDGQTWINQQMDERGRECERTVPLS